ncbi:MAG: hypothetical protein WKF97_15735 [Chitinophagaceae bacterium]
MHLLLSFTILVLISQTAFSQGSDFITVKKRNNRTLRSYFPGAVIRCQTVYGNYISGSVHAVRNDSVFVKEYDIRAVPTPWGVSKIDTLGTFIIGFHYKDIDMVIFENRASFGFIRNGALLIIGGLGYGMLNVLNGRYLDQPIGDAENRKSLAVAFGVAGAGYMMNRLHKFNNRNGKKYRVEYVRMDETGKTRAF